MIGKQKGPWRCRGGTYGPEVLCVVAVRLLPVECFYCCYWSASSVVEVLLLDWSACLVAAIQLCFCCQCSASVIEEELLLLLSAFTVVEVLLLLQCFYCGCSGSTVIELRLLLLKCLYCFYFILFLLLLRCCCSYIILVATERIHSRRSQKTACNILTASRPILGCSRSTKFCCVGKNIHIIMKPTNSPTQGQPNSRKK